MDLVQGKDFLSYVRPQDQLDESRLRSALAQLVAAVLALHGQYIIHRDLKPSNVMVDNNERLVVLDFGLVLEEQRAGVSRANDGFAGTPRYMAPEQGLEGQVTGAADWYAVGVMLYEALTGQPPFTGATPLQLLQNKASCAPPPLAGLPDGLQDLANLAIDLLRGDPLGRPDAFEIAKRVSAAPPMALTSNNSSVVAPLVGRETQLAALHSAYSQVELDGQPVVVFVCGRSGEGKTSLVERFLGECRKKHTSVTVLAGRCYDRESVPFKALDNLIDVLATYLRSLPDADAALLMPDDIGFLAHLFPVLQRVSAVERLTRKHTSQLDQLQVRARAFAALRSLLSRLTRQSPVVLFSDDLQWGDADSVEVLSQVLRSPDAPQLLFIGSYRSDEADTSPFLVNWRTLAKATGNEICSRDVSVAPLSAPECIQLAIALLGQDSDTIRRRAAEFAEQTGGNPFLLTELIGCFDHATDSFRAMPIHEVIDQKLKRLPLAAASLLDGIAVSGQALTWEEAVATVGLESAAISVLMHMRSEKLVRLMGPDEAALVDTYHDKIRETVLDRMDAARRRELHHALATVIESGDPELRPRIAALESGETLAEIVPSDRLYDLAYHFDAAGDVREACLYALLAAEQASRQFSQQVAAEQFTIAKRNAPAGNVALQFRIARGEGRALSLLGRYDAAGHALRGAVELTSNSFERAQVLGLLAEIAHKKGQIDDGVRQYAAALRELKHWTPISWFGLVVGLAHESIVQIGHTYLPKRLYFKDQEPSREESLAVELANRNSIVSYYSNGLRMLWTHIKGVNLAETRRTSAGLAYAYGLHPAPMAAVGLCARGLRYSDKSLELAKKSSDLLTQGHCLTMRSMAFFTSAQYEAGVADASQSIELLSRSGDPYLTFIAEYHYAVSAMRLGKITAALDMTVRGFERAIQLGEDASAGPMISVIALASQGNFPFPALRACFRISEDNHFSGALTGLAEGLWHLNSSNLKQSVDVLQAAWNRAAQHCLFVPATANLLTTLITAQRLYATSLADGSRERRLQLRRAWWNLRFARLFSRLFLCERAYVLREQGLLLYLAKANQRGIAKLNQSIQTAESHGDVYQRAITLGELGKLEFDGSGSHSREEIAEAESLLNKISHEIQAYRRQHWPKKDNAEVAIQPGAVTGAWT
jgi:tetratricopeptide (TPR) repeat protein